MSIRKVVSFEGTATGELGGVVGESTSEDTTTLALTTAFQVETPSTFIGGGSVGIVQRIFIEAQTEGVSVTPSVIIDGTTYALSAFSTAVGVKQQFERAVNRTGFIASVRLDAAASLMTKRIEISAIEADMYIPGPQGS